MAIIRVLLLLMLLVSTPTSAVEICKRIDEEGNVLFFDCPDGNSAFTKIELDAGPSDEKIRDAKQSAQKQIEAQDELFNRTISDAESVDELDDSQKGVVIGSIACDDPIDEFPISISPFGKKLRPISTETRRGVVNLLSSIEGRWNGEFVLTTCFVNRTESETYSIRTRADWDEDELFVLDHELPRAIDSSTEAYSEQVDRHWFQLMATGLNFDTSGVGAQAFSHRGRLYGVHVEHVESRLLVMSKSYRARFAGGNLHQEVWTLRTGPRRMEITQYLYVQGAMVREKAWKFSR